MITQLRIISFRKKIFEYSFEILSSERHKLELVHIKLIGEHTILNSKKTDTFEAGFNDRSRLGSEEDFLGVFSQLGLVVAREDQISQKAHTITNVIAQVIFGQTVI